MTLIWRGTTTSRLQTRLTKWDWTILFCSIARPGIRTCSGPHSSSKPYFAPTATLSRTKCVHTVSQLLLPFPPIAQVTVGQRSLDKQLQLTARFSRMVPQPTSLVLKALKQWAPQRRCQSSVVAFPATPGPAWRFRLHSLILRARRFTVLSTTSTRGTSTGGPCQRLLIAAPNATRTSVSSVEAFQIAIYRTVRKLRSLVLLATNLRAQLASPLVHRQQALVASRAKARV